MNIVLYRVTCKETIESFELATELDLTVYDVMYLHVGEILGAPVLTADEVMWENAGRKHDMRHIKDY